MKQFAPENRLRDHVNHIITRGQCGRADLIEIMRLVRLVLEHNALSQTYLHASLYCDWIQHGEIDRHRLVFSLLEKMNEAIASYDNSREIASVSRLLSLADLRAELIVLFASYQNQNRIAQFIVKLDDLSRCSFARSLQQANPPPEGTFRQNEEGPRGDDSADGQ